MESVNSQRNHKKVLMVRIKKQSQSDTGQEQIDSGLVEKRMKGI